MSTDVLTSRLAIPHVQLGPCSRCSTPLEFLPPRKTPSPSTSSISYRIRCFQCGNVLSHSISSHVTAGAVGPQSNSKPSNSSGARKGRKIGTDERPLVGAPTLPLSICSISRHTSYRKPGTTIFLEFPLTQQMRKSRKLTGGRRSRITLTKEARRNSCVHLLSLVMARHVAHAVMAHSSRKLQ